MPRLAMAMSLLLLLSSILLISISSQTNEIVAIICTDESNSDDQSASPSPSACNSQDSNSLTHPPSGSDGNGEVIPLKHTKKYFNPHFPCSLF
jgi:hypothetical protein